MTQIEIELIEEEIRHLKAKLSRFSILKPLCRKCNSLNLMKWGDTFKCKDCGIFTQKPKHKRVLNKG